MDAVFRALADPGRRALLDALRQRDGQSIIALTSVLPEMTRFGVAAHLDVLVEAGLATKVRVGREQRHFLNAVPLQEVAGRWLSEFSSAQASVLLALRDRLETDNRQERSMTDQIPEHGFEPDVVYRIAIRATPERIWQALTEIDVPRSWMWHTTIHSDWMAGSSYRMSSGDEDLIVGTVVAVDPPHHLLMTFDARWDAESQGEPAGHLEYRLQDAGDGVTELTVALRGLSGSTAAAAVRDTPEIYSALKTVLETGTALRSVLSAAL